ncbi:MULTISPECIES: Rid family hydrolase [unclassified Streptomyces]|uniref:Rid family hydrolase n=1 Tax=unclassified Streptomyces TaxID=2593676 RepID=UPI0008058CFA|nr:MULTISPECIES: Rid family hydrolase [unclassified Streptomyces]MYR76755.1 enamine deaminase RidA [Streptomyces sp. SID4925]SBU96800.1 Enamine deaminase RidA, house cleaning of reactive enamine intermediates, YjgF/YER057c/UK114 family [Streptomyces sp. OspMP-M45]
MERTDIGPRHFGGKLGYHRAVLLTAPRRWLVVAGHEARDAEGAIAHVGDIRGQLRLTFQRLDETLREAGFALRDVVQLRLFTTDILEASGCGPASVMAEVAALSDPRMLVEIEALAAR